METHMEFIQFFRADSVGSIVIRGLIWLVGVLIFAAGVDSGKKYIQIKADAGWFFLFLFGIGILSYILFGFVPTF
jgi:hypothetical protein